MHLAVIWQRFLPYHRARLRHLRARLDELGHRLTAVEVASMDGSYDFPLLEDTEHVCCFPGSSYHSFRPARIFTTVRNELDRAAPDLVLAPATPFPEGMAAITYRTAGRARAVMMDDAWEHTDRADRTTRWIKRRIHRNVDAAFVPAESHVPHYVRSGFPRDRIVVGVDVVDNGYFAARASTARMRPREVRNRLDLPDRYFLFVGRILPRKGIETLLDGYRRYRDATPDSPWALLMAASGGGSELPWGAAAPAGVRVLGPQFGDDLCEYLALASALVVPSDSDPWALVINEGMASGLPILASRGCGAARELVRDADNGFTFAPSDSEALAALMFRLSQSTQSELSRMGLRSRAIISEWSLDRFTDGVLQAAQLPRRSKADSLSNLLTHSWKGRVRTT